MKMSSPLKTCRSPTHRSEGPQLLTPQQASPRPGNRNGEPTAGGTRDSDTTPEGVQRSDSRDTDEGQSPHASLMPGLWSVRPCPIPVLKGCSIGTTSSLQTKGHPATQAGVQYLRRIISWCLYTNLNLGNLGAHPHSVPGPGSPSLTPSLRALPSAPAFSTRQCR
jgi:hypothetical protein